MRGVLTPLGLGMCVPHAGSLMHRLALLCCCRLCNRPDFPETGGASIREMASEIGHNIGEKLGMHQDQDSALNSKADEAMSRAADKVADSASSVVDKARQAMGGGSSRDASS